MLTQREQELHAALGGPSREALERLIYVVGSARGGTSITRTVIALHDQVIALGGPSHFLNHVWRYRKVLHDRLWRQLLWTPRWLPRQAVRESLPDERRAAFNRLINTAIKGRERLASIYTLYPLVVALDPEEKRDPGSYVAWLDKGNDFWGVDELPKHFAKGRFVFIFRDPRGAIASLAKRTADARADTEFQVEPRDVIESAIYWRNLVQRQLRFARRHPGQTVPFRFEELATDPVTVAASLYDALGLPPEPEDALEKKLDGVAYGASLDSNEKGKGISDAPLHRWKARLDQRAVDLIAAICGPTARKLGYDFEKPAREYGTLGVLRQVPGGRARLATLAKLLVLRLREPSLPRMTLTDRKLLARA